MASAQGDLPIDVLVAHPEPEGRAVIRHLLRCDSVRVVALTGDRAGTVTEAARLLPAVVVLDDRLSGSDFARALALRSKVVLLTAETDPQVIGRLLRSPASGYLVYDYFDPEDLLPAVHAVAGGLAWLSPLVAAVAAEQMRELTGPSTADRVARWDHRLTDREREVLHLLCDGMSNAAIATALELAEKTVKNHLNRGFAKLGVHNRVEAVNRLTGRRTNQSAADDRLSISRTVRSA
jgi:DNA-binding NarL/FixJ family response regulator